MDIKQYISSGILEQYVCGQLSAMEQKAVENVMRFYPEVQEEVEAIEKEMERYADAHRIEVNPEILKRTFAGLGVSKADVRELQTREKDKSSETKTKSELQEKTDTKKEEKSRVNGRDARDKTLKTEELKKEETKQIREVTSAEPKTDKIPEIKAEEKKDKAAKETKEKEATASDKVDKAKKPKVHKVEFSLEKPEEAGALANVEKNVSGNSAIRFFAVAAAVLLLISVGVNAWLYAEWQKSESLLAVLEEERQMIAGEMEILRSNYESMSAQMNALEGPEAQIITMKGETLSLSPQSIATVIWNSKEQSIYLMTNDLPFPPTGMQYQLWAIIDGNPVNAGVFEKADHIQGMKNIDGAPSAFAVTLEPMGGSTQPTLDQMYLIGSVS